MSQGTSEEEPRGEYVIVVEGGKTQENPLNTLSIEEQIDLYVADGLTKMEAVKRWRKNADLKIGSVQIYDLINRAAFYCGLLSEYQE